MKFAIILVGVGSERVAVTRGRVNAAGELHAGFIARASVRDLGLTQASCLHGISPKTSNVVRC